MKQHTAPCAGCPFRRSALPGWLGGAEADDFLNMAMSDAVMPCHCAAINAGYAGVNYTQAQVDANHLPQCAGRAVFWANQFKMARVPGKLLELPADRVTVFEWPHEFREHHGK